MPSDGFQETLSPDGELFGTERLLACVAGHSSRPAREMIQTLYGEARRFARGEPQRDDMAAVVIKAR